MAWNTPKTDWAVPDIVNTTDMNNIGNNLIELYNGNVGSFNGVAVVSASQLAIDDIYQTFYITGSTNISYIYVGNRATGKRITLVFDISAGINIVSGAVSPAAGYGVITSAGNIAISQWDALDLILIGPQEWVPIYVS